MRWWCLLCGLEQHTLLDVYVLANWNNSPQEDMLLHTDTLFWFWANQPLLLLHGDACLAESNCVNSLLVQNIYKYLFQSSSNSCNKETPHKLEYEKAPTSVNLLGRPIASPENITSKIDKDIILKCAHLTTP